MDSTGTTNAADAASARAALDDALLALRAIADPKVRVRPASRELSVALEQAYVALASSGDWQGFHAAIATALERARAALAALEIAPSEDPGLHAARARVAAAVDLLAAVRFVPGLPAPDLPRADAARPVLVASRFEPRLLDVPRGILRPVMPLPDLGPPPPEPPPEPPPPPKIDSLAALRALRAAAEASAEAADDPARDEPPPPARAPEPPPKPSDAERDAELEREIVGVQLSEDAVAFDRARMLLEDLAVLGSMRRPLEDEDEGWTGSDRTEARLLARVDALAACDPALYPRLVKLLEDRPVPDPELTWAVVFFFGSLAGDDALDQALRVCRASLPGSQEMIAAIVEALALAPHPSIDRALRAWLSDPEIAFRLVALRALTRRRALSLEDALAATRDPDGRVMLLGARALAACDVEVPAGELGWLLARDAVPVARAAMEASIVHRRSIGARQAIEWTAKGAGGRGAAALIAAVACEADGVEAFRAAARAPAVPPPVLTAMGWLGSVEFVDVLVETMRAGPAAVTAAAAGALQRITGASLEDGAPMPAYAREELPFTRAEWEPPEVVVKLSQDPEAWAQWWAAYGVNASAATRYRYGGPWTPTASLWEVESDVATREDRKLAWLELVARTGLALPFDPDAFVAKQRRQIDAWREALRGRRDRDLAGRWVARLT